MILSFLIQKPSSQSYYPPGDIYVSTTGSNDTGDGTILKPYLTLQHAVDNMSSGDIIYLRGGTYAGNTVLTTAKNGTSGDYSIIASYPGELAVLDGENDLPNTNPDRCVLGNSNDQQLEYWKIDRLEIKNGRTADGTVCGAIWGDFRNCMFRNIYVHDNIATVNPGSDGGNGGLRGTGWQNCVVEYCIFENNGAAEGESGHNYGDINIFSDYVENPASVDIDEALKGNVFRYNYFKGSIIGIKYKNSQWLSLSNTGTHTTHQALGDKIHHNIFENYDDDAIIARQDFIQVYQNIFIDSGRVIFGEGASDDREPFHACAYNNHFIGTRYALQHSGGDSGAGADGSSYDPPIIGPHYGYNNIIEDVGSPQDGLRDVSFHQTYSSWDVDDGDITMSAIEWENNLITGRGASDDCIVVGDDADLFTVAEFISAGYSTTFYRRTDKIFTTLANYTVNGSLSLEGGSETIANGGYDDDHPYLSGVTIPAYMGPGDPSDYSWIAGVAGLTTTKLRDAPSGDHTWVES